MYGLSPDQNIMARLLYALPNHDGTCSPASIVFDFLFYVHYQIMIDVRTHQPACSTLFYIAHHDVSHQGFRQRHLLLIHILPAAHTQLLWHKVL
jgi:hypothetical protein